MTVAATYSKIVEMVAGTSGIGLCQEELPLSLSEADRPIAVVSVGPATWNEHAGGLYRQVRTYIIDVYVQPTGEGIVPDEGYKKCLTPLYNVGRTFVTNWTLDGTVDHIGAGQGRELTFSDSGVQSKKNFAGMDWYGFALTLSVTEKAS